MLSCLHENSHARSPTPAILGGACVAIASSSSVLLTGTNSTPWHFVAGLAAGLGFTVTLGTFIKRRATCS